MNMRDQTRPQSGKLRPMKASATALACAFSMLAAQPALAGPVVHFQLKKADPNRGVVKLVRHQNTHVQTQGDATVYTMTYDELCAEPCGVEIDTSERSKFYFVRDGQAITHPFRLHTFEGEIDLKVKPQRPYMYVMGISLCFLILPIPLAVAGASRVWVKEHGADDDGFTKLKLSLIHI